MDKVMDNFGPTLNWVSTAAVVTTIMGILPPMAAALSVVWFLICIHESRPFQHWKMNWIMKHRAKKLARLRAKEKVVVAQIKAIETIRAARVEARELVQTAKSQAAQIVVHESVEADLK